jgi:uncharacterized membrane protein
MRKVTKGALIATTVAGLFATAAVSAADAPSPTAAKVKCLGINSCKGKGLCSAPELSHSCAGKNECKGKGWIYAASADECTTKGGRLAGSSAGH